MTTTIFAWACAIAAALFTLGAAYFFDKSADEAIKRAEENAAHANEAAGKANLAAGKANEAAGQANERAASLEKAAEDARVEQQRLSLALENARAETLRLRQGLARHVSPAQRAILTSRLHGVSLKVRIMSEGNPEARQFRDELAAALRDAGAEIIEVGENTAMGNTGLEVYGSFDGSGVAPSSY